MIVISRRDNDKILEREVLQGSRRGALMRMVMMMLKLRS